MNFKYLLILVTTILVWNCQPSKREHPPVPTQNPNAVASSASNNNQAASNNTPAANIYGNLIISVNDASIKKGTTKCFEVIVADFKQLLSMQYTVAWDPAVLKFEEVKGYTLPSMSSQNFGTHITAQGKMTVVWIDNALKGVTKKDGAPVYEICFNAIGEVGSKSSIDFIGNPTIIEVVNLQEQVLGLKNYKGTITVE